MKKILLSVIALFAAISMNAEPYKVLADDGFFTLDKSSGWGGHWYAFAGEGTEGNFDASQYDYVWIKFSGNTGKFRFAITYNEWKSTEAWGETFYDTTNFIEDAEGISFIKIEKDKKYEFGGPDKAASAYAGDTWDKHVQNVFTQDDGNEVSVTVEGIYFGTAAELEALLGGGGEEGGEGGEEGGDTPAPAPAGDAKVTVLNVDNALGLDADNGTALTAGTEIGKIDEVICTIGADDTYKPQEVAGTINGAEFKGGLQGGTNPKDADSGVPATTLQAPVSGAFLQFDVKEDGYLYIIHKASSNKAYTVFEEGTAIGYKFAAQGDAESKLGATYQFELKGEGELNELKNPVEFAEQEYLKVNDPEFYESNWEDVEKDGVVTSTWKALKINGLGVIAFPVFKDCKYIVNANGSKITAAAFAFSKADDLVVATEDGVEIYKGGGETAIQSAKVVKVAANGAIYNLAGQKVNASYKGVVIKDGKKYLQK
ncbi:MAG: hypothetical protein IKD75_09115 [Prevotella sp.]|nr:hypothetical protein [Prevotella sp.]